VSLERGPNYMNSSSADNVRSRYRLVRFTIGECYTLPLASVWAKYTGAREGAKVARLAMLYKVSICGTVIGETWVVCPQHGSKREPVHCAECFLCGWMVFERAHRRDASDAVVRHVRRDHEGFVRDLLLRDELRKRLESV
jgi:hypothetical protein